MLYFWLVVAAAIFLFTTYMCITVGFKKWVWYYMFAAIAVMMFFFKKWMMKRMEKHIQYMEEQRKKGN